MAKCWWETNENKIIGDITAKRRREERKFQPQPGSIDRLVSSVKQSLGFSQSLPSVVQYAPETKQVYTPMSSGPVTGRRRSGFGY